MDNMTDSGLVNRVVENAGEDFWFDEVLFDDLRLALRSEGEVVYITEPSAERWAHVQALNLITMALWDPQQTFEAIREEAPNNGDDLVEQYISSDVIIGCPNPMVREDKVKVCRARGYIRKVGGLAAEIVGDGRQENYTFRVYRQLAESETTLEIGTNPIGQTHEFYGRRGPVKIVTDDPDGEKGEDVEVGAASESTW